MALKRYKYVEALVEDYLNLQDEKMDLPLLIEKFKKKQDVLLSKVPEAIIETEEAEDLFKAYSQIKKTEERLEEANAELDEVEEILKGFLATIPGHQLSYERKDDLEKLKIRHLFWLENGMIQNSR